VEQGGTKPEKPMLIYDGACDLCKRWIARWRHITGDRIEYEPYQEAMRRFPEIPESEFLEAVHLIEPDGRRSRGAEAVFRALATVPRRGGWLWAYRRVPGFAAVSERWYRMVAGHRR
jgi:predicted DCC family thiol-disulfide oxidoreductase YuxK